VLAGFCRVRDEIRKVFEAYAAGLREGGTRPKLMGAGFNKLANARYFTL
jgi:hypothetical protein